MRLGKYILTAAAATMAVAPAMAANPAASLSVSKSVRTGSVSAQKNELAGGGIIVAILAAAAVVAGIIIVADIKSSTLVPEGTKRPPAAISIAWSADGTTLFAGYTDNVIRVFEVARA